MTKRTIKPKETLFQRHKRAQDVAVGIEAAKRAALPLLIKNTLRKTFLTGILTGMLLLLVVEWLAEWVR